MKYHEFIEKAYKKAAEKNIPEIFEKEANYVETGYDRIMAKQVFKQYGIIPRYFNAVENVDTTVEIFGQTFSMPIFPAALSRLTNITEKPIPKIAQAAKELQIMTQIGISDEELIKETAAVGAPLVKLMKPYRDFGKMKAIVELANECGLFAVGVDLDLSFGKKANDEIFFSDTFSPKSADQIHELIQMARIPFILKGVLSVEDAVIARDIGCSAIVVTNHGNMKVDYQVQPLEVLPEIREAVGPEIKIFAEGNISRGSDIYKCLALGADAVCVGKMAWMGLIAGEVQGVIDIFQILNEELRRYMQSTAAARLSDINSSALLKREFIIP